MAKERIRLAAALLIFLCLQFSSVSPIQQKNQSRDDQSHEVTVALKLIQVYVTDKDGNPVSDLKRSDFILYDNGDLKEITDFERHSVTIRKDQPEEIAPMERRTGSQPGQPTLSRKFILFLDLFQNDALGFAKAKKAALHFVDNTLEAGDEVCVLSYQEDRGIIPHSDFTSEITRVHEVLEGVRGSPAKHREPDQPEEYEIYRQQNLKFILDLKELARYLGTVPGFKNLVYFSGGLQRKILYDQWKTARLEEKQNVGLKDIERGMSEHFEKMAEELAASNTQVYAINTLIGRQMAGSSSLGDRGDHALKLMSDYSGGKYYHELDHYEEIVEDIHKWTANYYVLGYYVSERWDGAYHSIDVRSKRPAVEVHAQRGYYNPKSFAEFSDFERSIHFMNLALSGSSAYKTPVRFSATAFPCLGDTSKTFLLLGKLPVRQLESLIQGASEFGHVLLDAQNNIVEMSRGSLNLASFTEEEIILYSLGSCPPGEYTCRIILRNSGTGDCAVGSAGLDLTEISRAGIKLWPPLLLQRTGSKVTYIKVSREDEEAHVISGGSIKDVFPFLTNDLEPVIDTIPVGTRRLYAVLRGHIDPIPDPEVELTIDLVSEGSGVRHSVGSTILNVYPVDDANQVLFLQLDFPAVAAGSYELEVRASESTQDRQSSIEIPIEFLEVR